MKLRRTTAAGAALAAGLLVAGCGSLIQGEPDPRWADYKSWYKITEGRTGTGDPTGTIGNVHAGPNGYRDVYVNAVGKDMLSSMGPYEFPEGTVIVKEQFSSKADWEAQKKPEITVSIKDKAGAGVDTWLWAVGPSGEAKAEAFCFGCHSVAASSDFVFTHEKFLSEL